MLLSFSDLSGSRLKRKEGKDSLVRGAKDSSIPRKDKFRRRHLATESCRRRFHSRRVRSSKWRGDPRSAQGAATAGAERWQRLARLYAGLCGTEAHELIVRSFDDYDANCPWWFVIDHLVRQAKHGPLGSVR
jgi:hypothetical protein